LPLIGFAVFTLFSLVLAVFLSFTDFTALSSRINIVGFKNYQDLFTNLVYYPSFFKSISNTLWLLLGVPIGMAAGLLVAALLNSDRIKGKKFLRVLMYFPAISGAVAINIVWRYIFNPEYGIAGWLFGSNVYWLSDPVLLKVALIIKGTWSGLGGTMLLYLAGMQGVPKHLYEAAEIDGANTIQKFFKITLPMLTPVSFYLLVMGVINGLQSYNDAQVFAQGHEEAQTIVYFIWNRGFNQGKYGVGTAASVVLSLAIMIVTIIQFRSSTKWVYDN
jgi:multiple sugar transport system permease protein